MRQRTAKRSGYEFTIGRMFFFFFILAFLFGGLCLLDQFLLLFFSCFFYTGLLAWWALPLGPVFNTGTRWGAAGLQKTGDLPAGSRVPENMH